MNAHVSQIDPISIANELIGLGDRATDERRDPRHYFDLADGILDAVEMNRDDLARERVSDAVAWLAS